VTDVSQSFGSRTIFKHVSFEIERDWKVALVAANGVGKTTLFNLITGSIPLQHGSITCGANVTPTIFAQDQDMVLAKDRSVIDNVKDLCPNQIEQKIRTFLGSFLFSGDDVKKPIKVLSGGEKNRVGMVCVLLKNTNLLLLDEPTNHLDIPSKEVLLEALRSYQGTLLFVSHDRDFVNDLATHIIELTPEGAYVYHGNYDEFRHQKESITRASEESAQKAEELLGATDTPSQKDMFELRKKAKKLERSVEKFEEYITSAEQRFSTLMYGSPEFTATQEQILDLKKKRDAAYTEWEKVLQLIT
jgi:ATP-binding cassette subfamily F protein 3